jgi:hypothetical protein
VTTVDELLRVRQLKEGSTARENENEMLNPANMPRLVTKIRNATEWIFYIQFPVEGTYRLVIYGSPYKQPSFSLILYLTSVGHISEFESMSSGLIRSDFDFDVEGTYRLVIYGSPYKQPLLRLCEFDIKCPKGKQDCRLTPFKSYSRSSSLAVALGVWNIIVAVPSFAFNEHLFSLVSCIPNAQKGGRIYA